RSKNAVSPLLSSRASARMSCSDMASASSTTPAGLAAERWEGKATNWKKRTLALMGQIVTDRDPDLPRIAVLQKGLVREIWWYQPTIEALLGVMDIEQIAH